MEVRSGCKQTEVGVIPEDWEVASLCETVDFANGKPHERDIKADGRYLLVTLDSIGIDGALKVKHKQTDIWDTSLKKDDIVAVLSDIAHGNLLGLCDLIPEDDKYVLNQRMGRLRLKVAADPRFVRLQINRRQNHFKKRGQGTSQRHIYRRDFDALDIPFPLHKEQRAIAAALSDVDALLGGLDRLIAKKRDLKQAAMQQLLTGLTRLPNFQGEWKQIELGSICSMRSGEAITSADIDQFSEYPCYGGNGVRGYASRFTHMGRYVLIGRQGALCGNIVDADGRFFASEHAIVVTASLQTDIQWLGHVLKRMNLNQYSESSAQPGLSVSKLLKLAIDFPSTRAEQTAIAAVLSDMDAELSALEARRTKTRALKQAMMQALLTGKIRLV
jgi:type I restriction enzyme, S subunit